MAEFISLLPMSEEERELETEYLEHIKSGVAPDSEMDAFRAYIATLPPDPRILHAEY